MLESLISSKTRIKLLLKFFLNPENAAYLRGLQAEFGESSNAIRLELNRFEKAGLITSRLEGNKKFFKANNRHPLFPDLRAIVLKHVGVDNIIDNIITRLGNVEKVYLTGDLVQGVDKGTIELLIVGNINRNYMNQLAGKVEKVLAHKIVYTLLQEPIQQPHILIWDGK